MSTPTAEANCTYTDNEAHLATGQTSQADSDMEMRNYPPFHQDEADRRFLQRHSISYGVEPQFMQRKAKVHRLSEGVRLTPAVENEDDPASLTRMAMEQDRYRYNFIPCSNCYVASRFVTSPSVLR